MQSRSLIKIMKEFFSSHPPLFAESPLEQENIIANLKNKIHQEKHPHIKIDKDYHSYYTDKKIDKNKYLYVEISNPYKSHSWYDRARVMISFEKEQGKDKLCIKPDYQEETFNFSGQVPDFFDFVQRVLEKYKEFENNITKNEKIKKLKKGAVLARIKELAQKKRFDFYLEEYRNKLRLSIRIGERSIVNLDIFYSRFQKEMTKIEDIVDAARVLEKSGIVANLNFKSQDSEYRLRHFTRYDSL